MDPDGARPIWAEGAGSRWFHPGPLVSFARLAEGICWLCEGRLEVLWVDEDDDDPWGVCEPCGRAFQVRGRGCVERIDVATITERPTDGSSLEDRLLGSAGRILGPGEANVLSRLPAEDRVIEARWSLDEHLRSTG